MKKLLLISLLIVAFLRLPSLFEPYWHGDEGITLTVGQTISNGSLLYADITDNKPPLLYWIAAFSQNLFMFKAATYGAALIGMWLFVLLVYKLNIRRKTLSSVLFAVSIGTPILEANIVNGEIFMIVPTMASMYALLGGRYAWVGVYSALGFLFKVPSVFDFAAAGVYVIARKNWSALRGLTGMTVGFAGVVLLTSLYFLAKGTLVPFYMDAFVRNIFYSSTWYLYIDPKLLLALKAGVVIVVSYWIYDKRRELSKSEILIYLWLLYGLFGATLSNRPYMHYLIQIVPPLCLALGTVSKKTAGMLIKTTLFFLVALAAVFQFHINGGMVSSTLSYYRQFRDPVYFDPMVPVTYEIADLVSNNTLPGERIFVWSDNSLIYALSKRPPATRYVSSYHVAGDTAREQEVVNALTTHPPRIVIVTHPVSFEFPAIFTLLEEKYRVSSSFDTYTLYVLKE